MALDQISKEQERMILGSWLVEQHLEDMQLFCAEDFQEGNIFRLLRQKKDLWGIAKTLKREVKDLLSMTELYNKALEQDYYSAVNQKLLSVSVQRILSSENRKDLRSISESINDFLLRSCKCSEDTNLLENLKSELSDRKNNKVAKYGLDILDKITGGIYKKQLVVLSAKTSVGKSAFALQVAENVSMENKVLYFPLEMSDNEMIERLLIRNSIVNLQELRKGDISAKEEAVDNYVNGLVSKGNLKFYEGINSLEKICTIIEKEKPYLAIIDQLSQVNPNNHFGSLTDQYGYITKVLKNVSMKNNVAILLLCQISVKDMQSETLASIKNASQISEDADNVIMLECVSREGRTNIPIELESEEDCIKVNLAKQRF